MDLEKAYVDEGLSRLQMPLPRSYWQEFKFERRQISSSARDIAVGMPRRKVTASLRPRAEALQIGRFLALSKALVELYNLVSKTPFRSEGLPCELDVGGGWRRTRAVRPTPSDLDDS